MGTFLICCLWGQGWIGVGVAVHARAADPGRVRYGFLASADCGLLRERMAAGITQTFVKRVVSGVSKES